MEQIKKIYVSIQFDEVQDVVSNWRKYAALNGVKQASKNSIQKVIGR